MSTNKQGFAERIGKYFELRDSGVRYVDAAREVGVKEATGRRYERAWKTARSVERTRSTLRFDW